MSLFPESLRASLAWRAHFRARGTANEGEKGGKFSKESSTGPSSAAMTQISASLVADLQEEKLLKAAWCA